MIKLKTDVRESLEGYRNNRDKNLSSVESCPDRNDVSIGLPILEILKFSGDPI